MAFDFSNIIYNFIFAARCIKSRSKIYILFIFLILTHNMYGMVVIPS